MSAERTQLSIEPGRKIEFAPQKVNESGKIIATPEEDRVWQLIYPARNKISEGPGFGLDAITIIKRYETSLRPVFFDHYVRDILEELIDNHRYGEAEKAAKKAGKNWSAVLNQMLAKVADDEILSVKKLQQESELRAAQTQAKYQKQEAQREVWRRLPFWARWTTRRESIKVVV